jgi:hypothetical protein
VQLYAGSSQQFIDDTFQNRIAEKLRRQFFASMGYEVSPAEVLLAEQPPADVVGAPARRAA